MRPRLRIVFIIPGIDRAAPERTLTSSGSAGSPSLAPICVLDLLDRGLDLGLDGLGELPAVLVVGGADLGGDREAGGDRDADDAHLGQVGPLAAEQGLHVGLALGLAAAERIHVLCACRPSVVRTPWVASVQSPAAAVDASRLTRLAPLSRKLINGHKLTPHPPGVKVLQEDCRADRFLGVPGGLSTSA